MQCAGALLGRDGTVVEYGNGAPAGDPAVAFPRAVDFGPAACLVVDRAAFLAAGGFRAEYAPAYYEDADLCLTLAERGLRTVYVPGSRVRHVRYASGGSAAAAALSARNRARFVGALGGRAGGPPGDPPAADAATRARGARRRCRRARARRGRCAARGRRGPAARAPRPAGPGCG